jgi:hypothetical protein
MSTKFSKVVAFFGPKIKSFRQWSVAPILGSNVLFPCANCGLEIVCYPCPDCARGGP